MAENKDIAPETENNIPEAEIEEIDPAAESKEAELPIDKDAKAEKKADKKSKAKKEIEELTRQRDEYLSALQRERADFDNFKKRNNLAVSKAFSQGIESAVEKLLPVADNLERAMTAANEDDPVRKGVEMVLRQMLDIMSSMGIEEIKAEGEKFDPNFHNAVMQTPAEDGQESGIICEVLQKGYKTADHVIRHSLVKVTE